MKRIKLKILAMLASLTVVFGVHTVAITASAETPTTESETMEEILEVENDIENPTFEDFLAAVQKEADRYGYGDEYAAAMDAIKTAATTKQVTLSTILSASVALAVIGYIIYSKVKDKTLKTDIKKLLSYIEKQSNGINGLIDGTNETGKIEADTHKLAAISQQELQHLTKGLCYLTTAFMTFSESHRYQASKKEQVELNCVKALKEIEKSEESAHEIET